MIWLYVKNNTNTVYQALQLMIDRRKFWCLLLKIDRKLHRYDQIKGGGLFEV